MEYIYAKSILQRVKNSPDPYFGSHYNMNLYRGCPHGCIYCDTRSDCYGIGDLNKIRVKKDALKILAGELPRKRKKGTVTTGSMNDPYMPVEKKLEYTRGALKLLNQHGFGVHIITKSTLVTRDIDIIKRLNNTYAAVSITITTCDDDLAKIIEPHAPLPSERFKALRLLREAGIYAGITLMPTLPFITDTEENIAKIIDHAAKVKSSYILFWAGMTLRDSCRDHYYHMLDKHFPHLRDRYEQTYGDHYICNSPISSRLYHTLQHKIAHHRISDKIRIWKPQPCQQASLPLF